MQRGETLIGTLYLADVDQPWFVCRFEPGDGWETARALFEAQADVL
ncbi:hypothetical protein [Actinomadura miaoliensis]